MATGIVKWFNDAKGFGFITPDEGGDDLFAHFSEIRAEGFKSLQENQRVSFEVTAGPKGKQASNIPGLPGFFIACHLAELRLTAAKLWSRRRKSRGLFILVSKADARLGQIIGRHFQRDFVTSQDADVILANFPRGVS